MLIIDDADGETIMFFFVWGRFNKCGFASTGRIASTFAAKFQDLESLLVKPTGKGRKPVLEVVSNCPQ